MQHELSERLVSAHRTGEPVAPLTKIALEPTLDDAYAVRLIQVKARIADGRRVAGAKGGAGLESHAELLDIGEPDDGHLVDVVVRHDPGGGAIVAPEPFLQPRIEPEIGFILGQRLQEPGATAESAAEAVAWVLPTMEIADSRIADWLIYLLDTIADNASSGIVVVGPDRVSRPRAGPAQHQLRHDA